MYEIEKREDKLILAYEPLYNLDMIIEKIQSENGYNFKKCMMFFNKDIYSINNDDQIIYLVIGYLKDNYYYLNKDIFGIDNEFLIDKDIKLYNNYFIQNENISVIRIIDRYANCNIKIIPDCRPSNNKGEIPHSFFKQLIKSFPNSREIYLYRYASISSIIGEFFNDCDTVNKYNNFVSKQRNLTNKNVYEISRDIDLKKYEIIIEEIKKMLKENYSELQWQEKLINIILLLYTKYVICLKKVRIKCGTKKTKELDYLLIDSDGNADIIELKKPFENCILKTGTYRDNYIPGRELTGSIQQVEKYLYYLNTYKNDNEEIINKKYSKQLKNIKVKLINPQGLIFCGRSNLFDEKQKTDFEIIKRQYKSLIEIITYDDLIKRLENIITLFK